jgi:hypothetical protein
MFNTLRTRPGLLAGDALTIATLTLVGFYTHGSLAFAGTRIWATFFPLLAAWFLAGAAAGVFARENLQPPAGLWRPVLAMLLAVPLFSLLRALALGDSTIPVVFVLVITVAGVAAMLVWRGMYWMWTGRRAAHLKTDG